MSCIALITLLILHADLFDWIWNFAGFLHDVILIPHYCRFVIEILLLLPLHFGSELIALGPIGALSEIDRVLEFGKVHGAIETVHGDTVIWLVDILLVVVLLLLLLFWLLPALRI